MELINDGSAFVDALRRQLDTQRTIATVAQTLITETDHYKALKEVCRHLGQVTGVSRVYLFENSPDSVYCSNTVEWANEGIAPVQDELQNVLYETIRYWQITLAKGELIRADDILSLPPDVVEVLEWQDIKSILVVPLNAFDQWIGFMGFDVCGSRRDWHEEDVSMLLSAASLVAAAFERRELEQQLAHSSRLNAVGSLAAGVAHEYNNLHAGIMGLIELSLEDTTLSAQTRTDLEKILKLIHRGVDLTGKLLGISRHKHEVETVDMTQVVEDAILLTHKPMRAEQVRCELTCHAQRFYVRGNYGELSQVLLNLLINALEATAESSSRNVRVSMCNTNSEKLLLEVEDSGPGIPEDQLGKLFNPFFTTKGKLGGGNRESIGLGLSIASQIVSQHQGQLTVRNIPGGGAAFRIELPLVPEPGTVPQAATALPLPTLFITGRIGIIEEEQPILDVMSRFLGGQGHYIECFKQIPDALAGCKERSFDLFFVDLILGGESGTGFLDGLKQIDESIRPEVIIMSGLDDIEIARHLRPYPGVVCIRKPFMDLDQVGQIIQDRLRV